MVARAAGTKADDDAYRLCRIRLRRRDAQDGLESGSTRCQMQKLTAGKFHVALPEWLHAAL
jgi:hypothetical protein